MYVAYVKRLTTVLTLLERLGQGRYGKVYLAECIDPLVTSNMRGRKIAVKIVSREDEYLKEIDHSTMLRHVPGVIRLLCVYLTNSKAALCFELGECSLMDWLRNFHVDRNTAVTFYSTMHKWWEIIAKAILTVNISYQIVHRDIKPENIVLIRKVDTDNTSSVTTTAVPPKNDENASLKTTDRRGSKVLSRNNSQKSGKKSLTKKQKAINTSNSSKKISSTATIAPVSKTISTLTPVVVDFGLSKFFGFPFGKRVSRLPNFVVSLSKTGEQENDDGKLVGRDGPKSEDTRKGSIEDQSGNDMIPVSITQTEIDRSLSSSSFWSGGAPQRDNIWYDIYSAAYRAPELWIPVNDLKKYETDSEWTNEYNRKWRKYDVKAEAWAAGCVLWDMLSKGERLFNGRSMNDTRDIIKTYCVTHFEKSDVPDTVAKFGKTKPTDISVVPLSIRLERVMYNVIHNRTATKAVSQNLDTSTAIVIGGGNNNIKAVTARGVARNTAAAKKREINLHQSTGEFIDDNEPKGNGMTLPKIVQPYFSTFLCLLQKLLHANPEKRASLSDIFPTLIIPISKPVIAPQALLFSVSTVQTEDEEDGEEDDFITSSRGSSSSSHKSSHGEGNIDRMYSQETTVQKRGELSVVDTRVSSVVSLQQKNEDMMDISDTPPPSFGFVVSDKDNVTKIDFGLHQAVNSKRDTEQNRNQVNVSSATVADNSKSSRKRDRQKQKFTRRMKKRFTEILQYCQTSIDGFYKTDPTSFFHAARLMHHIMQDINLYKECLNRYGKWVIFLACLSVIDDYYAPSSDCVLSDIIFEKTLSDPKLWGFGAIERKLASEQTASLNPTTASQKQQQQRSSSNSSSGKPISSPATSVQMTNEEIYQDKLAKKMVVYIGRVVDIILQYTQCNVSSFSVIRLRKYYINPEDYPKLHLWTLRDKQLLDFFTTFVSRGESFTLPSLPQMVAYLSFIDARQKHRSGEIYSSNTTTVQQKQQHVQYNMSAPVSSFPNQPFVFKPLMRRGKDEERHGAPIGDQKQKPPLSKRKKLPLGGETERDLLSGADTDMGTNISFLKRQQ